MYKSESIILSFLVGLLVGLIVSSILYSIKFNKMYEDYQNKLLLGGTVPIEKLR